MTTSPSEPVDEQGLGDDDLDQTGSTETDHDQDSEPTSTAPADGNPTVPDTGDADTDPDTPTGGADQLGEAASDAPVDPSAPSDRAT